MTGNGVMHNGTTILDEYGHNLDRLKVTDAPFHRLQSSSTARSALCSCRPAIQWAWCGKKTAAFTSSSTASLRARRRGTSLPACTQWLTCTARPRRPPSWMTWVRGRRPADTWVYFQTNSNGCSSSVDLPPLPEDGSDGPAVMSPGSPCSVGGASTTNDLRFHQLHGTNAVITNGGRTALRQNCRSEFNDAIVISNR